MNIKLICLAGLLFLSINQVEGQYIPMVEEDKYWIYINHSNLDFPSAFSGDAYTFEGDTIINSLTYKKVQRYRLDGFYACQLSCWTPHVPYRAISKFSNSFIREDTLNRKVYYIPGTGTNEILIFDFSLGIGDTLNQHVYDFIETHNPPTPPPGMVDSLGIVPKYNKNRPTVFTHGIMSQQGLPYSGPLEIYQGVGLQDHGFILSPYAFLHDYCDGSLGSCQILSDNATIEARKMVTVLPNPTKGFLQIEAEQESLANISIYTIEGRLKAEFSNQNQIDISDFETGIYLLEIVFDNNERFIKKIIKEN